MSQNSLPKLCPEVILNNVDVCLNNFIHRVILVSKISLANLNDRQTKIKALLFGIRKFIAEKLRN